MIERTIERAEDGTFYSIDAVTIEYKNTCEEKSMLFFVNPNSLYSQIHDKLTELSGTKIVLTDNEEQNRLKRRVVAVVRACIKGGLIAFGNDLLTLLYGTKQHEKPARGDDIVDWYMDQFTKIGIAYMMKSDIVLEGCKTVDNEHKQVIQVTRCFTRPVTKESTTTENISEQ
jgi:hypothetical protein